MAAHNNLVDLMTQITNLESNISSIIMEFASKLSSLTDLHLFLVLENRERRKVCGSPHLVEKYAKGGLRPFRTDLLVDVESNDQRNLDAVVRVSDDLEVVDDAVIDGADIDQHQHRRRGRRRRHHQGDDDVILDDVVDNPAGDAAAANGETDHPFVHSTTTTTTTTNALVEPVDVKPNLKRRMDALTPRDSDAASRKRSRGGGGGGGGGGGNSEFVVNHLDQISAVDDDDDDVEDADAAIVGGGGGGDMVCIPDVEADQEAAAAAAHGGHIADTAVVVDHHGAVVVRRFQEHLYRGSEEEEDIFMLDFAQLNLPEMKMDFLKNVENPQILFEKGSVEFRLMNSLLYDFGKSLAYASPYPPETPQSKLFFFQNLTRFINMFPCFKSELLANIKIDSKTPIANLRMNARAGFNRAVIQRKKLMIIDK